MKVNKKIAKFRRSSFSFLNRHIKLLSFSIIILTILLVAIIVPPIFKEGLIVTSGGLEEYAKRYLSEYRRLVEENMAVLDKGIIEGSSQSGSHNLTFYWHPPKKIEGVISRSHGAAVFFDYPESEILQISIKRFSEPIEYYVWPDMIRNTTGLPVIRILEGVYHLDSQVTNDRALIYGDPGAILRYTGEGRAFNILDRGAIIIFGSLIEEDRMILKGSNNKEDWSQLQARFDALCEFAWDCKDILNETTIKTLEAKYKLPLLLEKIGSRIESDRYRENPELFTADFEELKEVGAPAETLSKILNDYLNMQENPPLEWYESLWVVFSENALQIAVTVTSTIIAAIIIKKYIEPKMKKRRKSKNKE